MSELTPELQDKIERVAHLRVTGVTWALIAKQFGYTNDDSARIALTHKHPDVWHTEYELARAKYLDEVEAEALLTQRSLLRSDDDRVKQSAAHSLLNHCRQLRAQKIEISGALEHTHKADLAKLVEAARRNGEGTGQSAEDRGAFLSRLGDAPTN